MAVKKHLSLFSQGVRTWNAWRKHWPKIKPDLRGLSATRADLRGINLSHTYLEGADLSDSLLESANLDYADLAFIDLRGATLQGASLRKAKAIHANFERANLQFGDLFDAQLDASGFVKCDFRGSNMREMRWFPRELHGANLSGLDLSELDFRQAELSKAFLKGANLTRADLRGVDFTGAGLEKCRFDHARLDGSTYMRDLSRERATEPIALDIDGDRISNTRLENARIDGASFRGAVMTGIQLQGRDCSVAATFTGAVLRKADLSNSLFVNMDLSHADLRHANLRQCNLAGALLEEVDLRGATLNGANLTGARLARSRIYGASTWNVTLDGSDQRELIITDDEESTVTADSLVVAQFLHLILDNARIREVLDTISTRVVLILGRFSGERKAVLEGIRERCRAIGLVPVLFDFEKPSSRSLTETVTTIASLSRCIIADLSDPRSVPHELAAIIPNLPSVTVQPIICRSQVEFGMFADWSAYPWVRPMLQYETTAGVIHSLKQGVLMFGSAKGATSPEP